MKSELFTYSCALTLCVKLDCGALQNLSALQFATGMLAN